jgi:tetratricopeptide (TPR) repeat protein
MFRHWIESKSNDSELLAKIRFALEKYLEIEEKDPYACFLLSLVFERIKKVDDAYQWIERANEYASERVMKYVSKNDHGKLGSSRVLLESIKQNHARILVLSGKYEGAIELINGMNDSSQPFYQIMLAVCYMSLMKLDLCIGATNEVIGDPKSNTEQKDYSWLLHCQCLHTMGNKKAQLESAVSNWQVVVTTI